MLRKPIKIKKNKSLNWSCDKEIAFYCLSHLVIEVFCAVQAPLQTFCFKETRTSFLKIYVQKSAVMLFIQLTNLNHRLITYKLSL